MSCDCSWIRTPVRAYASQAQALTHAHRHTHILWCAQTHLGMWSGVFNQTCSSPPSVCPAVRWDAGHCRFILLLFGYVATLAGVQTFWLGYRVALKLSLSLWLYDSSPWRQKKSSDLITHTAAISDLRRGLVVWIRREEPRRKRQGAAHRGCKKR